MTKDQIVLVVSIVFGTLVLIYGIWLYANHWRQRIKDRARQFSTLQSKVDDLAITLQSKVDDLETKNIKRERDEQYDKVQKLICEVYPKFTFECNFPDFWKDERRYKILNSEEVIISGSLDDIEAHCLEVRRYKRHKKQVKR